MATTQNNYTGNGSTTNYSFTFPYIEQTDVKVLLDGTPSTAFTLANATTVSFSTAPGNGVSIIIFRDTANDERAATFFAGSAIKAEDLNLNFDQAQFVSQETENNSMNSLGSTMTGQLNMSNQKIVSLGTPTAATDASTRGYVDTLLGTNTAEAAAAAASEAAAATSEGNAATSETNAANSASAAATSATNAATSATSASGDKDAANLSYLDALASATNAATSETNAATSETNAATSATNAATSASNASTSETNAATSATSASTSATSAASSAASALAAFDNFDDVYLGPKASAPTTDNDGDALTGGDLYYDTTNSVMKLYTGSAWVSAYVPGDATGILNNASGNLTSTVVQDSLEELQGDIDNINSHVIHNDTSIVFKPNTYETVKIKDNQIILSANDAPPEIRFLAQDSSGHAFGETTLNDHKILVDSNGFFKIEKHDSDYDVTILKLSEQISQVNCNSFVIKEGSTADNLAEDNRVEINPRANDSDVDKMVIKYVKGTEYNSQPVWGVTDEGTVTQRDSLTVGRQHSDDNTPVPYYSSGNKILSVERGMSGDTTKRCFYWAVLDDVSSDSGDLNNMKMYNSLSTSTELITTNDSSSHLRFGIKMNGMTQSKSSFFAGRCEGDSSSPVSVYGGSSTCSAYGDGAGGVTYIRGDNNPTSSHMAVNVDNDNSGGTSPNNYAGVKFKVRAQDGRIYQDYGSTFSNADYAEFFEWTDGNTASEYRAGHSVVLVGEKIRLATDDDKQEDIIGIVSPAPGIVGDSACNHWDRAYQKDQFGKEIMTPVKVYKWNPERDNWQPKTEREAINAREGCEVSKFEERIANGTIPPWVRDVVYEITDYRRTKNTDWDRSKEYIPREDRPEWDAIGLVGKLWLKPGQPTGDRWKRLKVDSETKNELWLVR
tara:strand:- start:417 stop:3113 length:2697 start_codon:yes stop_codon:yes gene_type:complete